MNWLLNNPQGILVIAAAVVLIGIAFFIGKRSGRDKIQKVHRERKHSELWLHSAQAAGRRVHRLVLQESNFFTPTKGAESHSGSDHRPLVLLVDDSSTALRSFTKALLGEPWRIETAHDGGVAWGKILKETPDLVITDLDMPGVDGIELLRRIRGDMRLASIPVILVTAKPFDCMLKAAAYGVNGFVSKPCQPGDLRDQAKLLVEH